MNLRQAEFLNKTALRQTQKKTMEEQTQDIVEILSYKAEIAVDRYKPLMDIREILIQARNEIQSLRTTVDSQKAEISRLEQIAQY